MTRLLVAVGIFWAMATGVKADSAKNAALIAAAAAGDTVAVARLLVEGADIAARDERDRKSTRLNSSHVSEFRMPSSA